MHRPGARRAEPGRAERAGSGAQPLTSQYPGPTGPALPLANPGSLLPPGRGPGPWAVSRCRAPTRAAPIPLPRGMSLLANYEGLRHQIERLVRENEELKKLVRLIRENHELKSAIKTQAGGLGISGFSTGFGQMAATPQHQGNCKRLGQGGGLWESWRQGTDSNEQVGRWSHQGRTRDHRDRGQSWAPIPAP